MKVKQKVIAGLVCAALFATDIFSVGFSVSASELNQQSSPAVENDEETEDSLQETGVPESKTDKIYPLEDAIAEETEDATKTEETESETRKEESVEESTEAETEVQQENSESEESVESEIESETQEQKTELENSSDSRKKIEKGELEGAYQFRDSPVDRNGISTYSVNLAADTNISELEEYLYQQMKAKNETIDVESYDISRTEIGNIVSGVINEHPDLYFINKGFSYSVSGNSTIVAEVIMSYDDSWDDSAFQRTTKKALAVVKAEMSDLEKAVALHDYLAVNCEYDKERLEAGTIPDESFSAYGVLVNRIAVCQGYALAYKYLLNQVGINCYMVTSEEMNHAWNLIELNGTYYQVDVTWDDPTWDLIGRVRHEYMFRSDDDFVNECKHHDWSVTKGNEVVDYKAVDTTYDTAFWLECDSPLVLVDKDCYYTAFNEQKETGIINRASLSDSTQKGTEICEIGEWTVWGNDNGYYFEVYSGLFQANNRLYFNDKTSIYSIDLDDIENEIDKRTEFTADTTDGYIYGSAFCQGKVLYSLRQEPIISSRDTVLTADIEIEQPSEILVEKIELDKKTLILTVGSTAKLQATITPDDATDLEVTWISSDNAVAKVENGTVMAIASGNCTITASAGGKTVSCDVTVNESGEDIASGSYKDITWVIDANGKLTVTGIGDFMENKESPWYAYKHFVISAEINVTGASDASYMFKDHRYLTYVDLNGFNTSQVTNMSSMFSGCSSLTSIDLSGFDIGNVTDISSMFFGCSSLTSIDLSGLDTGNVTNMSSIFLGCSSLTDIDVSSFNTRSTAYMSNMFENCSKLTYLDLSNFNLTNFEGEDGETEKDVYGMLDGCINITSIHTPYNLSQSVTLPATETGDIWYQSDGIQITELPQNLGYSIIITKNSIPSILEPYLTVTKAQTFYEYGDILNLSDLKVMYHNVDGTVREVNDFGTNKDEIDMSTAGVKILKISYNNLEATVRLNVKQCIASGSYEGITWIINSKGKLVVKGTGDFAEPSTGDYYGNHSNVDVDRAPWFAYKDSIISAEVNVTGMTDASYMFNECRNLKSIELGELDTESITNMIGMFCRCESLEDVNVSKFNTGNVTSMGAMFYRCLELTSIDVSGFDTSKVTNMSSMFGECWSLKTLDVSGFDTSKVTSMSSMFWSCLDLKVIDVSGFDTSKVTSMGYMFTGCMELTCLDMSGFDVSKVTDSSDMFLGVSWGECGVTTIYTPRYLKDFIALPSGNWYQPDGTVITELPKNLPYSILIKCGTIPTVSTSHIAASKAKKVYTCGDTLDINDLTVRFYDTDGIVKTVTDYTTNADTIDMSTVGTKKLIVTYKGMTTEIKLTVTKKKAETVTISGISVENSTYTKTAIIYKGTASVKLQDGTDVTDNAALTYTYSGTQADGIAYEATQNAPVNAGNYKLTVAVDSNNADYTGSTEYSFTITKSPLTITARDMGLKIGAPLPQRTDYQYDTAGLFEGDSLTIQPTLTCSIADTTKAGTYDIIVSGADAGMNYEITYKNGTLTISETGESVNYYTVTFSLSGHGSDIINTGVKEGSILEKPQDLQSEGYTFAGWYKDQSCTVLWDFDKDTVQSDITLYASWTKKDTIVGDDEDDSSYADSERIDLASASVNGTIANIKAKVYDQNAYEPVVKVTVTETVNGGKKKITLTEGADYRVLYQDNVNAGEGKVIVKGNGIYKGQIEKTFTISPKPVKKLKVLTGGIVGTATMQAASDAVYVYDGTKRLVENVDYELSDVQPIKNKTDVVQVTVKGKKTGNYDGEATAKITVYESGTDLSKLITPDSVTLIPESQTKAAGEAYAYTGKAVKPEVTVKIGDILLDKKAYKVQYQNNKDAGTAYVIVTGKGEYRGKAVIPFTIKVETQESTGGLKIKPIKEATYNGKLQKPSVKVTIQKGGKTKNLSKKDYTVTYKDNLHAGIAAVTVTGKGNYAGLSATTVFKINQQQIRKASLKGTQGNLILTYNKRTLREGIDYEILKYETVNKNKVKVTIRGKKDFANEMEKTIKVQ